MKNLFIMMIFLSAVPHTTIHGAQDDRSESQATIRKQRDFLPEIVLEPKSKKKALVMSILLPGLGEHYMGSKSNALRGYVIETGIWSTFFGARWYAGIIANDCLLYAYANADAKKGRNEEYYEAVEWYKNLEEYNTAIREEARWLYPDSREKQLKYIEEHSLPNSLWWEWQDEAKWNEYRNLRSRGREIIRNTSYCIGGAILNRIVSAIIATHLPTSGLGFQIEPNGFKILFALK